ncbi:MAG: hypothetical protein GXY52_06825 [Chloroflexi bacterium]|nr:hypothetical protein [Chloroflexota bacterium]
MRNQAQAPTLQRSPYIWYAVAVLCGILIGLLFGRIFSAASELRATPVQLDDASRISWISMAAEGFALTGNDAAARSRLEVLISDDYTWKDISAAIEGEAAQRDTLGDSHGALQLRQLSQALNLPAQSTPVEPPGAQRSDRVGRILLFIGAVTAFLGLVALGLWMMARQTLKRQRAEAGPDVSIDTIDTEYAESDQYGVPSHALPEDVTASYYVPEELDGAPQRLMPSPAFEPPDPYLAHEDELLEQDSPPAYPVDTLAEGTILGTYEAEYTFGIDDFDCSFTISLPDGVFMGDCGVGVSDVLPAVGAQHVDALEVWLFDKGDVSSVSKFLVTEYTYENPTLNNRLSAKGELVLAEPGAVITLETRSLRVTAQVVAVEYDSSLDPNNTYFQRVLLELTSELAE